MIQVGKFEKVSYEQFYRSMKDEFGGIFDDNIRELYDAIQLPSRATAGSAGYDFKSPITFTLVPGNTIKIPTGVRVKIDDGWWLGCFPRSGLGFKYRLQLNNTVGVIDSDYYYSGNEGHIFAKVTNDSNEGRALSVEAGDGFVQAIFLPYGITYDDAADGVRDGGMGSAGRQRRNWRAHYQSVWCSRCREIYRRCVYLLPSENGGSQCRAGNRVCEG